jgi:hypothetical protein
MKNIDYYNTSVVDGYYDIVFRKKKGIQSAWHHIKFNYIKNLLELIFLKIKLNTPKKTTLTKKLSLFLTKTNYLLKQTQ